MLTVVAGTVIGMPALTAAWRAVIWPGAGLQDLAHEDVLHLVRRDARPLEFTDGRYTVQAAAETDRAFSKSLCSRG